MKTLIVVPSIYMALTWIMCLIAAGSVPQPTLLFVLLIWFTISISIFNLYLMLRARRWIIRNSE